MIRPFFDNLEVQLPWLFYNVPYTNPDPPFTPFVPRFWDEREHWESLGVGIVPGTTKPYFGPIPNRPAGPLVGTPAQWLNGLSYAVWLAGGYADPVGCWPIVLPNQPGKLRRGRSLFTVPNLRWLLWRGRSLRTWSGSGLLLRRLRMLRAYPALGFFHRLRSLILLRNQLAALARLRALTVWPGLGIGLARLRALTVWPGLGIGLARLRALTATPAGAAYTARVWLWLSSGDTPTGLNWGIWSDMGTGSPVSLVATDTIVVSGTFVGNDRGGLGYDIYQVDIDLSSWPGSSGTWWLQLESATSAMSQPVYWDISDGPAQGWYSPIGPVGDYCGDGNSESATFQLYDTTPTLVWDNTNSDYPGTYYSLDECLRVYDITDDEGASTFVLP